MADWLFLVLGCKFLLSLQVVLSQVTVLTHAGRVVTLVWMATGICFLAFTFSVVAIVAHVFSIMLSVSVWALVDFLPLPISCELGEDLVRILIDLRAGLIVREDVFVFQKLSIRWGKIGNIFFEVAIRRL